MTVEAFTLSCDWPGCESRLIIPDRWYPGIFADYGWASESAWGTSGHLCIQHRDKTWKQLREAKEKLLKGPSEADVEEEEKRKQGVRLRELAKSLRAFAVQPRFMPGGMPAGGGLDLEMRRAEAVAILCEREVGK